MRWAAKKDAKQTEIVNVLRSFGYLVDIRSEYGKPDLSVRKPGWPESVCVQMETKTPNRKDGSYVPTASESKRRKKQQEHCVAFGVPYIKTAQEAMDWIGSRFSNAMVKRKFCDCRQGRDPCTCRI